MAVTRDQARRLLSESEMALFGDSRNPTLRRLSARDLTRRVERTRKLRDKSRDLLRRQKLGTRSRTGSKGGVAGSANERTARKGEVLEDVLQRFESRLDDVQRLEEVQTSRRSPARATGRTTTRRQATAGNAPARKATAQPPSRARRAASGRTASKALPTAKGKSARAQPTDGPAAPGAARAPAATGAGKSRRRGTPAITSDQALANTRQLLQAKQQRDREPRAYRMLDAQAEPGAPGPGFQSETAKAKAQELHAGEIRMDPIHGSISTRDRQSQGKRDHR